MLDSLIKPRLTPLLDKAGIVLSQNGLSANKLTLIGFGLGFVGCFFTGMQIYPLALLFLLGGRLLDGLDGAVARATQITDLGVFLDTMCDFIIFAAFPFFFILGQTGQSMAAAFLLFSYLFMGMAYLAHQWFATKKGLENQVHGGVVENTEMILFMVLCCLFPAVFSALAAFFGLMCCTTAVLRMVATVRMLRN